MLSTYYNEASSYNIIGKISNEINRNNLLKKNNQNDNLLIKNLM